MSATEVDRQVIYHIDPSLEYRPEDASQRFRNYTINPVSGFRCYSEGGRGERV